MRHHYTQPQSRSGDHWAVGSDALHRQEVLVQLQENGEQVRLAMSVDHAEAMARALLHHASLVRQASDPPAA